MMYIPEYGEAAAAPIARDVVLAGLEASKDPFDKLTAHYAPVIDRSIYEPVSRDDEGDLLPPLVDRLDPAIDADDLWSEGLIVLREYLAKDIDPTDEFFECGLERTISKHLETVAHAGRSVAEIDYEQAMRDAKALPKKTYEPDPDLTWVLEPPIGHSDADQDRVVSIQATRDTLLHLKARLARRQQNPEDNRVWNRQWAALLAVDVNAEPVSTTEHAKQVDAGVSVVYTRRKRAAQVLAPYFEDIDTPEPPPQRSRRSVQRPPELEPIRRRTSDELALHVGRMIVGGDFSLLDLGAKLVIKYGPNGIEGMFKVDSIKMHRLGHTNLDESDSA